jgi:hypothetical protein
MTKEARLVFVAAVIFALCVASASLRAQTVSITGTVTNDDQLSVKGATVALQRGGLSAVTDAKGEFSLSGNAGVVSPLPALVPGTILIRNGVLRLNLAKSERVVVFVCDCRGRLIATPCSGTRGPGLCSVDCGAGFAGLEIVQVVVGSTSHTFRSVNTLHDGRGLNASAGVDSPALAKNAAAVDSLLVTAARYKPLARGLDSYSQSNLSLVIASLVDTGIGANLHGVRPFPDDNPWNTPVDKDSLDPKSSQIIAGIGISVSLHPDFCGQYNNGVCGIPYVVVTAKTPKVNVTFDYADESDPGPYPIPADAPIEGGATSTGDRHILIIERDSWILYELWSAYPPGTGWTAGSGAIFRLGSDSLRQAGWTSADAAGLPVFPGLVRYDEVVEQKAILHAVRFTVVNSRHAYLPPATHYASSKAADTLPPMGMRVRLKASVDISGYSASMQVILKALKTYGMIMADNGSNWYVSGAPDSRFDDNELNTLKQIKGGDFEVVKMRGMVTQ